MSLSTLAADEVRRVEKKHPEFALKRKAPGKDEEAAKAQNALEALTEYIPAEIITLYIAASSVMGPLKATFSSVTELSVYWFFVALTPIVFFLIYVAKRRHEQLPPLPSFGEWPIWRLMASTFAFAIWAQAVPTSPYLQGTAEGGAIAAFGALLVSTFLKLFDQALGYEKS